jgi:type IV pilus assembly protein PilA
MLQAMRRRIEDDKGFTLIELMVVVLIIAILLAVAIPTFLRVRRNAQDRAAQNTVSAALKAQKAFYTEGHLSYVPGVKSDGTAVDLAELKDIEASISYFGGGGATCAGYEAGPKCVNVSTQSLNVTAPMTDQTILVAQSASSTFWAIRDKATAPNAGTFYNRGGHATEGAAVTNATADSW